MSEDIQEKAVKYFFRFVIIFVGAIFVFCIILGVSRIVISKKQKDRLEHPISINQTIDYNSLVSDIGTSYALEIELEMLDVKRLSTDEFPLPFDGNNIENLDEIDILVAKFDVSLINHQGNLSKVNLQYGANNFCILSQTGKDAFNTSIKFSDVSTESEYLPGYFGSWEPFKIDELSIGSNETGLLFFCNR